MAQTTNDHGLGRIQHTDPKDKNYPMRLAFMATPPTRIRRRRCHWTRGPQRDQGREPKCTAFAWANFFATSPLMTVLPPGYEDVLYSAAQSLDPWAGQSHDGSTVRAAAKAAADEGRFKTYTWGETVDDIVNWLLTRGPVVVGTDWTRDMFTPGPAGLIKPTGPVEGGHAYCLTGVDLDVDGGGVVEIFQSWGLDWGLNGLAYMRIPDLGSLVFERDGESCVATERKLVPLGPA